MAILILHFLLGDDERFDCRHDASRQVGNADAKLHIVERSPGVCRDHAHDAIGGRREPPQAQIASHDDDRDGDPGEHIRQIAREVAQLAISVAQLFVDGLQLFVRGLNLSLRGLELLVRALKLLVARLHLFVCRAQLLARRFAVLDDALHVHLECRELFAKVLDLPHLASRSRSTLDVRHHPGGGRRRQGRLLDGNDEISFG